MRRRHLQFRDKVKNINIMFIIISLIVSAHLFSHSSIMKGLDPQADALKEETAAALLKEELYEGSFLDMNGDAITQADEPGVDGYCLYPQSYSWLIGYNSAIYGSYGLRDIYQEELWYAKGKNHQGAAIQLTTDNEMQVYAYEVLSSFSHDGSVIILDNDTGAIRAFVSRGPVDLDVNDLSSFMAEANQTETAFLRRGTEENDPPGSCWKLVTAAAALSSDQADHIDFEYEDTGVYQSLDGCMIYNYNQVAYGLLTLADALCVSSNVYFAHLAMLIGPRQLAKTYDALMMGQEIELDFTTLTSNYHLDYSSFLTTQSGFGQGELEISPLHLAAIGTAFANEGKMMKPYLIQRITSGKKTFYEADSEILSEAFSEDTASKVLEASHEAALYYGFDEETYGYVSAKTSTADTINGIHTYLMAMTEQYTLLISTTDSSSSTSLIEPMQLLLEKYH